MHIFLWQDKNDPRKVDKGHIEANAELTVTGDPVGPVSYGGFTIAIAADAQTSTAVNQYNYVWIRELSRYYFVRDWTCDVNGIWMADLDEDVLWTFASKIHRLSARIERAEADSLINVNLPDPLAAATGMVDYTTISATAASDSFLDYSSSRSLSASAPYCFVVELVAEQVIEFGTGADITTAFPGSTIKLVLRAIDLRNLLTAIQHDFTVDLTRWFVSAKWLPVAIPTSRCRQVQRILFDGSKYIELSSTFWYALSSTNEVVTLTETFNFLARPQPWEYDAPYTQLQLRWRPYGMIDIPPELVSSTVARSLTLDVDVNIITGESTIITANDGSMIASCNVSVPQAIVNGGDGFFGGTMALLGGISNVIGGSMSGGFAGLISGGVGMFTGIANSERSKHASIVGSQGSPILDTKPRIIMSRQLTALPDAHLLGRPSYKTATLVSGLGYVKVIDADMSSAASGSDPGFAYATASEVERIKALLMSGVFL